MDLAGRKAIMDLEGTLDNVADYAVSGSEKQQVARLTDRIALFVLADAWRGRFLDFL